jgi:hypothetical protein
MRLSAGWRGLQSVRTAQWLTADRVAGRAVFLIVINLILSVYAIQVTHSRTDGHSGSVDFVSFYAAGRLALAGQPAAAYDRAAHEQAEAAATEPGRPYQFFFYPPPYLLLCAAVAALPYFAAFAVFEVVTLALFLLVIRAVAGPAARGRWLLPVLGFTPLFWTAGLGQNAFLTAALLGGATMLIDRRPLIAGLLFGLCCYKPHFGLLVPLALLAGGRWRAIAAAGVTVAAICAATVGLFGVATWQAYLPGFLASGSIYGSGRVSFVGLISWFGAARLAGLPPGPALWLQCAASLAAAAIVGWTWWRGAPRAVRGAALLAGTMTALPVVLLYDQMITLVALTWLAREGRSRGFLPWEKATLAAAYLLAIVSFPLAMIFGLPLAPLPAALLLALCVVRTGLPAQQLRNPLPQAARSSGTAVAS